MELETSLSPLIPILATLLGASLTWFFCHNRAQTMRIRHRERCKALLKSAAELEACCAKLESEVELLRLSEAEALRREAGLEARLTAEQQRSGDRERLLGETEFRILRGFRDASLTILRHRQDEGLKSLHPIPESHEIPEKDASEWHPSGTAARLRDEVASSMLEGPGNDSEPPRSDPSASLTQTKP